MEGPGTCCGLHAAMDIRGMAALPPFRLQTLGRLDLLGPDGQREQSLATRRRKLALLALLALHGRPLSRDRLVELFWGDHPEERARHSLSDALSHLRRVLGPGAITARRVEVELAEGYPLTVDLRELAAAAAARDWPRVLALYEGPFLDGMYLGGSADWEHWVHAQRMSAARHFVTACRAEGERLEGTGDWAALERLALRWLEASPEDPTATQWYATAIARQDQTDAAVEGQTEEQPSMPTPVPVADRSMASVADPSESSESASVAGSLSHGAPRWRHRRTLVVAGALCTVMGLVAFTALRPTLEPTEATFSFTTRSPAARQLVERASAGIDGGVSRTEAVALLQQAIALDSGFAMAYRTLALLHAGDRVGHPEVARLLTRAVQVADQVADQITPFERALVESSYHLLVTGDLSRAAGAQRRLIRLAPQDGDAWHDLGMTYQYAGDDLRAADAYREALARDRTSASTWANLLDALVATDNRAGAALALDSMSRAIPGHPMIFLTSARVHAAHGALPEAERQIRAYLASSPDAPRRQGIGEMTLARILWTAGRLDDGDAALDRAVTWQLRLGDTVTALRESLAKAMVQVWLRGDRAGAAGQLDAALRRFPLQAMAPEDQPLPELALVQGLVGRARAGTATLAAHDRQTPAAIRHQRAASVEAAVTTLALARGDGPGARAAHQRYLESPPTLRTDLLDALHVRWVTAQVGAR